MKILLLKMLKVLVKSIMKYLSLIIFLETKPQVKDMNNKCHDLYYTVIETRDDIEIVNNNENDYIKFIDIIIPNQYVGIKKNNEILK